MLVGIPSFEEVKYVVFGMDPFSSPRPDGYIGRFLQSILDIMGKEIRKVVLSFFKFGVIQPGLNSNFLTLTPKVANANVVETSIQLFWITLISNRLGVIVRHIISPNKFGFIKGWQIQDSIVTASDYVNIMDQKCFGGAMALKVDIRKALILTVGILVCKF